MFREANRLLLFVAISLTASDGHQFNVQQTLAPVGGDLVRRGHQPVVLIPYKKGDTTAFKPLEAPFRQGGFSVLRFPLRQGKKQALADLEAIRKHLASEKTLDPERIYGLAAGSQGLILAATKTAANGLIWLTPVLEAGEWKAVTSAASWHQRPLRMVADLRDRFAVTTLKAILGSAYKKPVHKVIRADLGRGADMLRRKPQMADQLLLSLKRWAGQNCDRTNQKKRSVTETGCSKEP